VVGNSSASKGGANNGSTVNKDSNNQLDFATKGGQSASGGSTNNKDSNNQGNLALGGQAASGDGSNQKAEDGGQAANNGSENIKDAGNVEGSFNRHSDSTTVRVTLSGPVTLQDLSEDVTGVAIAVGAGERSNGGNINTGYVSVQGAGNTASFAGVSTQTSNTGIGNANQTATAISANSNITFGSSSVH
ncbi:MAG: hypothetical protein JO127_01905, partial [Caulobacteraceae bacterium]|nr:hypothetical protein [Caulobacteraceae bacterium]